MFYQNYADAGAPRRATGLKITRRIEGKCYSVVSWTVHRLLILHILLLVTYLDNGYGIFKS
jgi:hypothetical protein